MGFLKKLDPPDGGRRRRGPVEVGVLEHDLADLPRPLVADLEVSGELLVVVVDQVRVVPLMELEPTEMDD